MANRDLEIAGLLGEQMAEEHEDDKVKRGPGRPSLVRFGAKPSGLHDDRLSTKPAPGPRGGDAADDIEWAKRRRRAQAEEERNRRG